MESASVPSVVLAPPLAEVALLEWIAVLSPVAMRRWHEPRISIAIITHRRPASLRRLLASLRCAHYLGDRLDLTFSLEHGADAETMRLSTEWTWPHGPRKSFHRAVKGGLIAAVVESWYPTSEHSYGILLEDDIEVSPFFYAYAKLLLLQHAYGGSRAGDAGGGDSYSYTPPKPPPNLLGISLYTPRLVELTMPRHPIDLYAFVGPNASSDAAAASTPGHLGQVSGMGRLGSLMRLGSAQQRTGPAPGSTGYGGAGHLFLQQLPCSWGQLFFPKPWGAFREYMRARLYDHAPAVNIKESACCQGTRWGNGGWGASWKKFLIELAYLRGYIVIYPNFPNQTSLSTNHLEPGEHIQGKVNALKHRPIDFTVPLVEDFDLLRKLWTAMPPTNPQALNSAATTTVHTAAAASGPRHLAPLAPMHALPTLDLFSRRSDPDALVAKGAASVPRGLTLPE